MIYELLTSTPANVLGLSVFIFSAAAMLGFAAWCMYGWPLPAL